MEGVNKLVGASNYPCNIGLNRRITGGRPDLSWELNGPNYVASNWDKTVNATTDMATFTDGASNTAIFSEWSKGTSANSVNTASRGLDQVFTGPRETPREGSERTRTSARAGCGSR